MGYKIREGPAAEDPYMLVVGQKEAETGTVSVRHRKNGDLGSLPVGGFVEKITQEIASRAKD